MTVSVRRPKAIVFDILGTASKSGFLEQILFPYLKVNLESYIATHWDKRDFVSLYTKISEHALDMHRQESATPLVAPHDASAARESLTSFINFVTENGINCPPVTKLRFKVWFEGYNQQKLKTPIYSDVPNKMRTWFAEGIKFYVFSNTWVEAQKALLRTTNHGDLTNLISGHFDNDFGLLTEPDSWSRLANEIRVSPNDVLFLTKAPGEGRAASEAGVNVCLVLTHRHNVKAITHEDKQRFPYVRTLDDLNWLEAPMLPTGGTSQQRSQHLSQHSPHLSQQQQHLSQHSQHLPQHSQQVSALPSAVPTAASAAASAPPLASSQPTSYSQKPSNANSHQ